MNKIKALIQWFMSLEVQEHRHWCTTKTKNHWNECWMCVGLFCVNVDYKKCPKCIAGLTPLTNEKEVNEN